MTGYESKRAAARDKLDDDDTQVYQTELTKLLMESYDRGVADALEETKKALAQPAQKPVAHCEAGPEYCVQCKLEDRSIVLAAAVRYVKNNTPQLVSDEICTALATPPQRPWVGLTKEAIAEFGTWYDNREEETGWVSPSEVVAYIDAKLKEKNG